MNFYGRYLQALLTFLNKSLHIGGVSALFLAQLSKSHSLLYIDLQSATPQALSFSEPPAFSNAKNWVTATATHKICLSLQTSNTTCLKI